jgi:lipoprotein-anchoring transpeptidase ErfK/SrfK
VYRINQQTPPYPSFLGGKSYVQIYILMKRTIIYLLPTLFLLMGLLSWKAAQTNDVMQQPLTQQYLAKLKKDFNYQTEQLLVLISAAKQELYLVQNGKVTATYKVSTSKKGIGSKAGSDKTPPGIHRIKEKFGEGAKVGAIFKGRAYIGREAKIIAEPISVNTDDVTTRILWLEGLEPGINKGEGIDSYKRYIYIHGTPEEGLIGQPASHGCIRMLNKEVIEVFNKVPIGTLVVVLNDL